MTEVTNRTIAALLFVAMAVTVFSTAITLGKLGAFQGVGITGFATSPNATATLNISSTTSIKFTNAVIDWSNGTVNTSGGNTQCNVTTSGYGETYTGCIGFASTQPGDFTLENDGNQNADIDINLTQTPTNWIGGTNANTYVKVQAGSEDGCTGGTYLNGGAETAIAGAQLAACTNMSYQDSNDIINISVKAQIPSDATTGVKTVDLVAYATPV